MGLPRRWRPRRLPQPAWALLLTAALAGERAGDRTELLAEGFSGPAARYVVTVDAAGARCAVPADFDSDGDLDLVVVSSNDNTVAWYERHADGSYGPKRMISKASNGARIVTTGDLDQDNRTDVIVASLYDHTVGWFRNLGGTFESMSMISRTAISAQGISVADIDNDGDLDVLSASSGDNTVAWYENLGSGRFCEVKNIVDSNSKGVRTVIAADLNEDGYVDLAVASKDDNSISWYRNDHHNHFVKIVIDDTALGAYSLVAKDVDHDGHLDLVTAANMEGFHPDNGEGGKVSFYRNGFGSGGALCNFRKVAVTAGNATGQNDFDWFVLSVWAGDLDLDGDVDIASASFSLLHQGGISWYENVDGAGNSWIRHRIYETPMAKTGHYVVGADVDGDGDNDLIAVTNGDNKVQILTARTICDNSTIAPRQECCTAEQYWNGSACLSCPQGRYLDRSPGASATCVECSRACPRPGLAFQPRACHSVAACGSMETSFSRCDCGAGKYLDSASDTCAVCPDGQITLRDRARTPADFAMVQQSFLDQTKYYISDMSWNGFNFSRCQIPQCLAGEYFNKTAQSCQPCGAGTYSSGGAVTSCAICPAGSACPAGASGTQTCQAGTFSAAGAEACLSSPVGFVTPSPGMGAPVACEPGTMAPEQGSVLCADCPVGSYAEAAGQSACVECGAGHSRPGLWTSMRQIAKNGKVVWVYAEASTRQTGNASRGEGICTCDVGSFAASDGECVACLEGLDCLGGPGEPLIRPGFHAGTRAELPAEAFVGVSSEFSVFACREESWCPGGAMGTCAEGRQGIGCSECKPGFVAASGGGCEPCTEGDYALVVTFGLAAVAALCYTCYLVGREKSSQQAHSELLIVTTFSLVVLTTQQVGVFKSLKLPFRSPLVEALDTASVLNLSLDAMRFRCASSFAPLTSYLLNLVPVPAIMATAMLAYGLSIILWYPGQFKTRLPVLINTLCKIFKGVLIAAVHVAVTPFHCMRNPNGLWALHKYPSVICGETGGYAVMVGVGLAVCLVPLSFLALVCAVVYEYPKRAVSHDSSFFRAFACLFVRFNPESVWYVVVFTARSLFVPLVPLVPDTVSQVLFLALLIGTTGWIGCRVFPWRIKRVNYLDSGLSAVKLLVICCLGFLVPADDDTVKSVHVFCGVLLIFCLSVTVIILGSAVRQRIGNWGKKDYQYFICHHKAEAAAQARLLKMSLQMLGRHRVFIDSDELVHLDVLVDVVQRNVEHVILYLTKDILTRPWCAGEIAAAVAGNLSLTTVTCPSWAPPANWTLDELSSYVDLDEGKLLHYGVTQEMVTASYSKLLSGDFRNISVAPGSDTSKFDIVVESILGRGSRVRRQDSSIQSGALLISAPCDDDEAMAAALIFKTMTIQELVSICPQGASIHVPCEGTTSKIRVQRAWKVLVILSRKSLTSSEQLEVIASAAVFQGSIVPLVLPDFTLPGDEYYRDVLPKVCTGDLHATQVALQDLFECVPTPFPTQASEQMLLAQCRHVLARLDSEDVCPLRTASEASASKPAPLPALMHDGTNGPIICMTF